MSRDNLELVERLAAAFSEADFETVFARTDPAIRLYPRPEEPGVDEVYIGHEGVLAWAVNWYDQWDEYEVVPVTFVDAPGNRVLVVFAERGLMERTGITIEQESSATRSPSGTARSWSGASTTRMSWPSKHWGCGSS